jgi:hypothetical protein
VGSAAIVWGGAWCAALLVGGTVSGGVGDTIGAMGPLASSPGDPAAAWGDAAEGLPGPVLYWACTAVVFAAVVGLAAGVYWLWRRWSAPSRVRLGVPAEARMARRRDVAPLVVSFGAADGRLLLGRLSQGVRCWRSRTANGIRCTVAVGNDSG